MYQDVTHDALRAGRLDEVTPLTPTLEVLGFEPLGLTAVGSEGAVAAVWVHRSGTAWAEPEWFPGRKPHLTFRSIFEDGTIVQTSMPREGLLRLLPFWTRQHHPKAGYFLEERAAMPHEVWARHQERIAEHARARSTSAPPHSSMDLFLAMAQRTLRIARIRTRIAQVVGLVAFLAVAIPVTFTPGLPDAALALTALVWVAASLGSFQAVRALPVPRIQPLSKLRSEGR